MISYIISMAFTNILRKVKNDFSSQKETCVGNIKEYVNNINTIYFCGISDKMNGKLRKDDEKLEEERRRKDTTNIVCNNGAYTINMISSIICMSVAAYFVSIEKLRFGDLTTSTQLLNFMFVPLTTAYNYVMAVVSSKPIADKFMGIIKDDIMISDKYLNGNVIFNKADIGYGDKTLIKNFSYIFEKNKKYAVIGESGIGKTTIALSVLGLTDIKNGSIKIGSIDITDIDSKNLYQKIFYVPQKTDLFRGTVLDNICFGDKERDAIEISKSVNIASQFLGSNTKSDNGIALSGGEQKRISIARALCSDAEVIIFDEPESGLDPQNAKDIEDLIMQIHDRTIIVITHNQDEEYLRRFDYVIDVNELSS